MRKLRFSILFLLIGFIGFVSCQSSYTVSIETQKPPVFNIPEKINGLLVVNNAVPQPEDRIIELKVNKKDTESKQKIKTDSINWYATEIIAQTLSDANFYEKISIYEDALRNDDEWLSIVPFTEEECNSLYEESGCNAIISIDRLLFDIEQAVVTTMENYFLDPVYSFLYLKCRTILSSSVYCKGKKVPLTSFTLRDSLVFNFTMGSDSVEIFRNMPEYAVNTLTDIISKKLAHLFTPRWEISDRLVYTSAMNAWMYEANKYFNNKKWNMARAIWQTEYYKKEKDKEKARLAMNIGVSFEMEDQLDLAVNWVQKAKSHYEKTDPNKMKKEKLRVDEYLVILNSRIQNNRILDIQF